MARRHMRVAHVVVLVLDAAEGVLDGVGQPAFLPRDTEDVDDVRGQQSNVPAQVQAGGGKKFSHGSTVYAAPAPPTGSQ